MSVRGAVRRHRDELGEALAVYRDPPGPRTLVSFGLAFLIVCALSLINPPESPVMIVTLFAAYAVMAGLPLILMGSETLVVCERGLILGATALGLRPYVIRFDQMTPGGVAPLRAGRWAARHLGLPLTGSSVRPSWWTDRAVYLVGPSAAEARRHRGTFARLQDLPPLTVDQRWVWVAGVNRDPREVVGRIAQAAQAAGCEALARASWAAREPVRVLTKDPREAAERLPGLERR
ncbi:MULTISPECIES: hypothetical protein [Brevibacterium]|uniref:Uncharacterized protein n=1 Tax=Brevibacterium salitolerans TaxID=1403566 RepID=A0ABN2WUU3_9MICO|nr:hypothetical protein [Brevibacterium sp.]